jgi:isopenicillin N synthase-like dioxygenase
VDEVAVIDVAPLVAGGPEAAEVAEVAEVARAIDAACREVGFFSVVGHGVDPSLASRLETSAREFFALSDDEKARIAMRHGGRAWRGWFPLGGELTAGVADLKEGLYFGRELDGRDPRVASGVPLHGPNLFPSRPSGLREVVLAWMEAMERLGRVLMRGVALGLGLPASWFDDHLTGDPTVLFRIFRYPPVSGASEGWGVAEHTDYGLLTILLQDRHGGLEVRGPGGWMPVPPRSDAFVCNIGDMLDRLTEGRYRSTAHRVRNTSGHDRLSFPFFLDPAWDAQVVPLPLIDPRPADDAGQRWDRTSVHAWDGRYGDYLTAKVAKVFPDLFAATSN